MDDKVDRVPAFRFGFVVEQYLGHRTHYQNLLRYVPDDASVAATWLPIAYEAPGLLYKLPPLSTNVAVRTSARAYEEVRAARRRGEVWDAVFYHTQTASLLSPLHPRVPTVISLDATPLNFDTLGEQYGHRVGGASERVKLAIYRAVFARATALVTWSRWAKESLVRDYGVDASRVSVIPPGVDLGLWPYRGGRARVEVSAGRLPRLLFVGGDFARKGGDVLLRCFRDGLDDRCELHIVTQSSVQGGRNLFVHNGVAPNSELLRRLYAEADLFVFPTLADCFAQVVSEAMAAGLPVVTTRVGATPEIVKDGETGLLVEPGDAAALGRAVATLLDRPELRASMGDAARRIVEAECDVRKNARLVLDVLKQAATSRGPASRQLVAGP
jgi:glycosyltransferase involved in cell wall biosynthesis